MRETSPPRTLGAWSNHCLLCENEEHTGIDSRTTLLSIHNWKELREGLTPLQNGVQSRRQRPASFGGVQSSPVRHDIIVRQVQSHLLHAHVPAISREGSLRSYQYTRVVLVVSSDMVSVLDRTSSRGGTPKKSFDQSQTGSGETARGTTGRATGGSAAETTIV